MLIPRNGSLKPVVAPKTRIFGETASMPSLAPGMLARILPRAPAGRARDADHLSLHSIKLFRYLLLGRPYGTPVRHHWPHRPLQALHFPIYWGLFNYNPCKVGVKSNPHFSFAFQETGSNSPCAADCVPQDIKQLSLRPPSAIQRSLLRSRWSQTGPAPILDLEAPTISQSLLKSFLDLNRTTQAIAQSKTIVYPQRYADAMLADFIPMPLDSRMSFRGSQLSRNAGLNLPHPLGLYLPPPHSHIAT